MKPVSLNPLPSNQARFSAFVPALLNARTSTRRSLSNFFVQERFITVVAY